MAVSAQRLCSSLLGLVLLTVNCSATEAAGGQEREIAVRVWRLDGCSDHTDEVVNACYLFESNRVGARLAVTVVDLSGRPEALTRLGAYCGQSVAETQWFTPAAVNVYSSKDGLDESCGYDRRVVYLQPDGALDSLAHELGHALGLYGSLVCGHADDCPESFSPLNIMWRGGGTLKEWFSRGQIERMRIGIGQFPRLGGQGGGLTMGLHVGAHPSGGPRGYASKRSLEQALRRRHAALLEHSGRHGACGQVSDWRSFSVRLAKRYFVAD